MSPRRVRVVAALIASDRPGEYLIQQRLPRASRALLWEFPGGKVEPGESDEAALVRECEEELGVSLTVGPTLWRTEHAYPDLTVELLLLGARIRAGVPQPLGANALEWATPERMKGLPFCEADLPLLDALAKGEIAFPVAL
jgi:8-oxo-dGTP diphosphatase